MTFDNEDSGSGIVYFGTIIQHFSYADIPLRSLRPVTTGDLMSQAEAIGRIISLGAKPVEAEEELDVLYEYHYISNVLQDRWLKAQETPKSDFGVFLSHASADKRLIRWIAVDLGNRGFRPWLDEWEITAGESIPKRLSDGIEQCRVMVVALSPTSVASHWVEREWHAKYWEEVEKQHVAVVPILLARCTIPPLLRYKKYADFTGGFTDGMDDLVKALVKIAATIKKLQVARMGSRLNIQHLSASRRLKEQWSGQESDSPTPRLRRARQVTSDE